MSPSLRHLLLLAAIAAAGGGATDAGAASLPAGSTAILSGAPSLFETLPSPVGPSRLTADAVSRDGAVVVFSSKSDGLVAGDDDTVENVYAKVRATGEVVLVNRRTGAAGDPAHDDCYAASISDDGKRVAFVCEGPLDPADTNLTQDVYVRDLASSTTVLASRASQDGPVGAGPSVRPVLSADGRYVAFSSLAKNLDPAAKNGSQMVYRHDLTARATELVSRWNGSYGPMNGGDPSISDDGTRIAFTSVEGPAAGDNNATSDVYLRDLDLGAGLTSLVSRADGDGAVGNGPSEAPAIAGDGTAVAFESQANSFDPGSDADKDPDVYRRSLAGKVTVLVSETAGGDKGQTSQAPSIDTAGRVVAFTSQGTQLDPADTDATADAYVKDVVSNELRVVSRADGATGAVANAGSQVAATSGDGKHTAFSLADGRILPGADPAQETVALRDVSGASPATVAIARPAGAAPFRNEGGAANAAVLSDDGRFAAFVSSAPGLGLPQGTARGVFVRDRVTGGVTLASREDGATGAPIVPENDPPAISADGRRVAWSVLDGPQRGVWVRDLPSGRTFLASRADGAGGTPADGRSDGPALDADGDRVAFTSRATNLGDGDTDAQDDVHVRDLAGERTSLVSSAATGVKGDGGSFEARINAAGTRVAFRSYATNLGDGDTDAVIDVHLKNTETGAVRLVSAEPGGAKTDASVSSLSLDGAGERVAFVVNSTTLLGQATNRAKVFVRDLAADTLTVASRTDAAVSDDDPSQPVISPDGGSVAYAMSGQKASDVGGVHVRDLASGATTLASVGATGQPLTGGFELRDLTVRAGCVSFGSDAPAVGARVDGRQAYLRVLGADCVRGAGIDGAGGGADGGASPGANGGRTGTDTRGRTGSADRTAPVVTRVRLRPAVLRIARGSSGARRPSALTFRSSEAGSVAVRFERVRGRRRTVATTRASVRAGAGRVRITGRVGRRALAAGRYRLVLTVRDAAGNTSKPVVRRLTVVRRRAR
jgi:Tol biopolymer transport system component